MTPEEWRPIPGFDDYEASTYGRIRSWKSRGGKEMSTRKRPAAPRVLASAKGSSGYLIVGITVDMTRRTRSVHALVAAAFIGPRPDGHQVCHGDGDRHNNRPGNLRYATALENMRDQIVHGTSWSEKLRSRSHCGKGHPFDEANVYWETSRGRKTRRCRICTREAANARRAQRRAS